MPDRRLQFSFQVQHETAVYASMNGTEGAPGLAYEFDRPWKVLQSSGFISSGGEDVAVFFLDEGAASIADCLP